MVSAWQHRPFHAGLRERDSTPCGTISVMLVLSSLVYSTVATLLAYWITWQPALIFFSIGCTLVVMGALFKVQHWPGAHLLLCAGTTTASLALVRSLVRK